MAGAVDALFGPVRRLSPPRLALALTGSALVVHALSFGLAAPLGQAPGVGAAVLAGGLGWGVWAAWLLRRAGTPIRLGAEPLVLVEEGPYRFGRHPMYLGLTVALLGLALMLGVPLLAVAAAAFAGWTGRVTVPLEEARLQRRFGGWYSDYRAQVRRWL
jgi:protein-S-isoprenylcysteine O-methyltransferase Ste14